MDMLSDVMLHANSILRTIEIARQKQQLLSGLRVNYDDADYLASAVFQRVVYGAASLRIAGEGTPIPIQAMNREDIVQFRDTYYSPGTALLAFSGDISPEAAFAAAEKYFGAWSAKQVTPPARIAAPENRAGRPHHRGEQAGRRANANSHRQAGIRRNDPEYIPLCGCRPYFRRQLQQPA